jgi:hypothetical protein
MFEFFALATVLLFGSYLAWSLATSKPRRQVIQSHAHDVGKGLKEIAAHFPRGLLLLGLVLAAFVVTRAGAPGGLIVVLLGALIFLFASRWLEEFRFLMELDDDAFPGRNDKLIWALLLIVLPPVGLWQFSSWRAVRWPQKQASAADPQVDLS